MTWSESVWQAAQPSLQAIMRHPFLHALLDGSLEQDTFLFYLRQDALYLAEFGKALSGIAAKLHTPEDASAFLEFAGDTISVEKILHESYLAPHHSPRPCQPSPTCLLYTSYVQRQLAIEPVETAVASILPCFTVYKFVGDFMLQTGVGDGNPYRAWIDTYGGGKYGAAVEKAVAIANRLAEKTGTATRAAMADVFLTCTKMEWMFWDSAWRRETWPL